MRKVQPPMMTRRRRRNPPRRVSGNVQNLGAGRKDSAEPRVRVASPDVLTESVNRFSNRSAGERSYCICVVREGTEGSPEVLLIGKRGVSDSKLEPPQVLGRTG